MDTTTSDQANKGQASRLSNGRKAVPIPPGMTEAARQARNRQYWEDKNLADQTAKNTEFNKNIKRSDLSHPIQP
ncbi:hypothetical protein DL763_000382 [Monosporascus cannonballus]|nr:hypothetical protein DL763_000382 [Monosporascus cannonballus]